jgi:hypothetical protein
MDVLPPSTSNGHVNPWERQPGESGKAFSAFCHYRDLGRDRSLAKVAESLSVNRQAIGHCRCRGRGDHDRDYGY